MSSKQDSCSRLSPLARPFTMNTSTPQSIQTIYTYSQCPSRVATNSQPINILRKTGADHHLGILRCKDKDDYASSKLGKSPFQGLRTCDATSKSLYGECIGVSGKDKENKSKETNQIDVEIVSFPSTSELCPTAIPNDLQTQLTYPMTCSSCDSNITSSERNFSQQLDAVKLKVSPLSENNSPVQDSGSSGTHTGYLPLSFLFHQNMNSDVYDAVSSYNPFSCNPGSIEEPCTLLNTNDKEVFHKLLIEKSKHDSHGKPISHEVMDSLTMSKSELQITYPCVSHDLTLKLHRDEEGNPAEYSTKMLGENESDLDSPCWKGTMADNQSTFEYSGPENSQHLKSGQEALSSYSPLASQLFPSDDKQNTTCCENECDGDNYLLFLKTASATVNLPSEELKSTNSVTAASSFSELSNVIGIYCSNDIHLPDKEHDIFKNSSSLSMLSLSCMLQPPHVENYCKSKGQIMTGPNVASSVRRLEDAKHNGPTSISFASNVFSSSSCRVGVPSDFAETRGGATRSFSRPLRLDIQKIVITMNKLSELLMQNCSNDLDSLNEHEHDIIKSIINNLTVCIRNRVGKRTIIPESSHPYRSYCVRKSADLHKCSLMELEATKTKPMRVSHDLGCQNEHEKQWSYSISSNERLMDPFSTGKDEELKGVKA